MGENEGTVSIIPLNNFDSNTELLRLDEGISLKRISKDELTRLIDAFPHSRSMLRIVLSSINYVIEMSARVRIGDEEVIIFDHGQPRMHDIILALRLLKSGDVIALCGFLLDQNREAYGLAGPSLPKISQNPYFLDQKEVETFKELWKKLRNVKESKPYLSFPLFSFNRTFEEKSPPDRIVDYMTVFESLVCYKEKRMFQPAGRVIGTVVGMLLGNNQTERAEIKEALINSYEVRSAKVHGNLERLQKLQQKIAIDELSMCVANYLRYFLRKFLEE